MVDPFGGVALGGLDAMVHGCHWVGVELEARFCDLAAGYDCPGVTKEDWVRFHARGRANRCNFKQRHWCPQCEKLAYQNGGMIPEAAPHRYAGNIDLWTRRYGHWPGWGSARLVRGDSRNLQAVVGQQVSCVVGSPPYAASFDGKMKSEDELHERMRQKGYSEKTIAKATAHTGSLGYGNSDGQLASLPEGSIDCVLSSPPYASGTVHSHNTEGDEALLKRKLAAGELTGRETIRVAKVGINPNANLRMQGYGQTPGNLGNLPPGSVEAIVSSPPYNLPMSQDHSGTKGGECGHTPSEKGAFARYGNTPGQLEGLSPGTLADAIVSSPPYGDDVLCGEYRDPEKCRERERRYLEKHPELRDSRPTYADYGNSDGNLGNAGKETFWSASLIILRQSFEILRPGGHAIFVVKAFVRAGRLVDFPGQWLKAAESVGFRLVCRHQATFVKYRREVTDLFGETKTEERKRASFFRRLAEKRGSPRIDAEDVLCLIKPSE